MSETTLDYSGLSAVVAGLGHMGGGDLLAAQRALRATAGAILKSAMASTKAASALKIKAYFGKATNVKFSTGEVIAVWKGGDGPTMFLDQSNYHRNTQRIGPGKAPKGAQRPPPKFVKGNMTWHDMDNRHWSDARWSKYQGLLAIAEAQEKANLAAAEKARGLTKQSWGDIARLLALDIGEPGYVKNARPARHHGSGFTPQTARQTADPKSLTLTFANYNSLLTSKFNRPSGQAILQKAINSRLAAFNRNMRLGVFGDIEKRAQRYPGVFTQ